MQNPLRLLLLFVLLAAAGRVAAQAQPPTVPGRLAFRLKPTVPLARVEAALARLGASGARQKFPRALPPSSERPGSVDLRGIYEVRVPNDLDLSRARTVLLGTGAVLYVEPLYIRQPLYQPNDPMADSTLASVVTAQYALKRTQTYRAWDVTRGDSSIVIGITDGGVRLTHEDLRTQVKHNYADPINGIDDDQDGYVDNFSGWDLANDDNDAGYDPGLLHGTYVAGCAAASVNNGLGIAGFGHNSRFMPLNIYPNTPNGVFAGFEAVVYAADHGCQVINMSWGGVGGHSQLEQDALTYAAVNRDAVLVAAAGNTNADLKFYPASYDHVLSVSGSNEADIKSPNATYSRRIDLVAPGISILTTYGAAGPTADRDYSPVGGTSFAAPAVAGAAALLRWHFPTYTAAQIAAQLRQTTDNIDAVPANAAFAGRLGTGRLNVRKALTQSPVEARVIASTFAPARPAYAPGAALTLAATVQNLLRPVAGISLSISSLSPHLVVVAGTFAVGSLPTLGRTDNSTAPFRLAVAASGVPLNTVATLRYRLSDGSGFQLDQYVDLLLNPDYVVLNINDLSVTLTSRGNIGYDDLTSGIGQGLTYQGGSPLLSEGGLLLATAPTRVADRLRTSGSQSRGSFFRLAQIREQRPGPRADQESRAAFQDSVPAAGAAARSVGVRVRQRGYAWAAPAARRDFVLLEYSLRNLTADTLRPLHAGLFMDWDLPNPDGAARNAAAWDSTRALGYCYNLVAVPLTQYTGVQLVRGGTPTVYSIDNGAPAGAAVRLADGFTPAEKFLALSSGTTTPRAGLPAGADVSQVVGARLAMLAPGDSATVVFAVLAAPSLGQLQAAADAATATYASLLPARAATATPGWDVFPNPTTGLLQLALPPGFGPAEAQVINTLGQVLESRAAAGPTAVLDLSGRPPGLYVVRVRGTNGVLTRAVILR